MYAKVFKRLFDIVISFLALPFVFFVVVIIAPFIYFEDKGSVFYNAPRRGKDGKTFTMFKLRSMYVNSPDIKNSDGSTFNSADDARVTKVGRFMRKTSIDELPQILNVFLGDMSFIGPRPTLPNVPYEQLPELSKKRLRIRPGITGYVQAYYRNSITHDEKVACDCHYVDSISLWFDLRILFRSVISVLLRKNIYCVTAPTPEQATTTIKSTHE